MLLLVLLLSEVRQTPKVEGEEKRRGKKKQSSNQSSGNVMLGVCLVWYRMVSCWLALFGLDETGLGLLRGEPEAFLERRQLSRARKRQGVCHAVRPRRKAVAVDVEDVGEGGRHNLQVRQRLEATFGRVWLLLAAEGARRKPDRKEMRWRTRLRARLAEEKKLRQRKKRLEDARL
jgi:hypothetical protein